MDQAALGFIFKVNIVSDQPAERIIEMFSVAEDGCYASDTVRNPVPMRAHLLVNGEEVAVDKRGEEIPDLVDPRWQYREDGA